MSAQRGFVSLLLPLSVILIGFVIVNLIIIDYQLFIKGSDQTNLLNPTMGFLNGKLSTKDQTIATDSGVCAKDCQANFQTQIDELKKQNQSSGSTVSVKPVVVESGTNAVAGSGPKEIFINIGGNGSTKETAWTDVSGTQIVFDKANYPGLKAVYFQASLSSDAPDLTAYARVYDTQNTVGVAGSDISRTSLTSALVESGPLNFISTKTKINVQIHSLNGNLAVIENPRLRLVF